MTVTECLQYFAARGVHRRGPGERIKSRTWAEWFEAKFGEPYFAYIERARSEKLGEQAQAKAAEIARMPGVRGEVQAGEDGAESMQPSLLDQLCEEAEGEAGAGESA